MTRLFKRPPTATRKDTKRPFRLWDAKAKRDMRWRYYADHTRAHNGALIEVRWGKPGTAIEVYDCRTGKMLGQYVRTPTNIQYLEGAKP